MTEKSGVSRSGVSDDMVERAARVMFDAYQPDDGDDLMEVWVGAMREALRAVLAVDDGMLLRATMAFGTVPLPGIQGPPFFPERMRAALEAALVPPVPAVGAEGESTPSVSRSETSSVPAPGSLPKLPQTVFNLEKEPKIPLRSLLCRLGIHDENRSQGPVGYCGRGCGDLKRWYSDGRIWTRYVLPPAADAQRDPHAPLSIDVQSGSARGVECKRVKGPAIVETPSGSTWELCTDIEISVPIASKVWRLEEEDPR